MNQESERPVTEILQGPPVPLAPSGPPWAWSAVILAVGGLSGVGWFLNPGDPLTWALVPYTMLGNSLAMIPYDWFIPAYVQSHPLLIGIGVATAANVLIEFWNMDVLARLLSRKGTAAFRGHRVTTRLLGWYRKAPWWTLTVAGFAPIVPYYPCRFLATLAHYPIWKYQSAIIAGRSVRYTVLAGIGVVVPIEPIWYFVVGTLMMLLFVYKFFSHKRSATAG